MESNYITSWYLIKDIPSDQAEDICVPRPSDHLFFPRDCGALNNQGGGRKLFLESNSIIRPEFNFGFTKSCMIWTKYLSLIGFAHKKFVSSLSLPKFQVHSKFIFSFEISEFFFKNPLKKIQNFMSLFNPPEDQEKCR